MTAEPLYTIVWVYTSQEAPAVNDQPVTVCDTTVQDTYGEMLRVCRDWIESHYPNSLGMAVYVWVDETLPPVRITIPSAVS